MRGHRGANTLFTPMPSILHERRRSYPCLLVSTGARAPSPAGRAWPAFRGRGRPRPQSLPPTYPAVLSRRNRAARLSITCPDGRWGHAGSIGHIGHMRPICPMRPISPIPRLQDAGHPGRHVRRHHSCVLCPQHTLHITIHAAHARFQIAQPCFRGIAARCASQYNTAIVIVFCSRLAHCSLVALSSAALGQY